MSQVLKLELKGSFIGDDPVRKYLNNTGIVCFFDDSEVERLHSIYEQRPDGLLGLGINFEVRIQEMILMMNDVF